MTIYYTEKEYGVRTVYVWGLPVSVSQSRGSLIVRTRPEYAGRTIQINGKSYSPTQGIQASRSFTHQYINGQLFSVVTFDRLPPGIYCLSSPVSYHTYEEVILRPNWCWRLDWSH